MYLKYKSKLKSKSNSGAFTLIELLGIIAIVVILVAVVIMGMGNAVGESGKAAVKRQEQVLNSAYQTYIASGGTPFPKLSPVGPVIAALLSDAPVGVRGSHGPFITSTPPMSMEDMPLLFIGRLTYGGGIPNNPASWYSLLEGGDLTEQQKMAMATQWDAMDNATRALYLASNPPADAVTELGLQLNAALEEASTPEARDAIYNQMYAMGDAGLKGLNYQNVDFQDMADADWDNWTTVLGGQDLSGQNFSGKNLNGVNLSNSNLSGADFTSADLRGANLRGSNLGVGSGGGGGFFGANLDGADLRDTDLTNATGISSLTGTNLTGATIPAGWLADNSGVDLTNVIAPDGSTVTNNQDNKAFYAGQWYVPLPINGPTAYWSGAVDLLASNAVASAEELATAWGYGSTQDMYADYGVASLEQLALVYGFVSPTDTDAEIATMLRGVTRGDFQDIMGLILQNNLGTSVFAPNVDVEALFYSALAANLALSPDMHADVARGLSGLGNLPNISTLDLSSFDPSGQTATAVDFSKFLLTGAQLSSFGAIASSSFPASVVMTDYSALGQSVTDTIFEAGTNLTGAQLNGATSLAGSSFIGIDLTGFSASGVNLAGTNLEGTSLTGAALVGSTSYVGANLTGLDMTGFSYIGSDLSNVNFTNTTNIAVALSSASNIEGANFTGVNLSGVTFNGNSLTGVNLVGTGVTGANIAAASSIAGANLTSLDLSGLTVPFTSWDGVIADNVTNLDPALFSGGTTFEGVSLAGVSLNGANVSGKNMKSANLTGAVLLNSNLKDADLTGSNFTGSNLSGSSFETATGITKEMLLSASDITGTNLTGLGFSAADLAGQDLTGVIGLVP